MDVNGNERIDGDDRFDLPAATAGAALRRRVAVRAAMIGAVVLVSMAGAGVLTGCEDDDPQPSAPADASSPSTTNVSASTTGPATTSPPTSMPEVTAPSSAPALTPEAVDQSFVDASTNPDVGALCGYGWEFCEITQIRTRDDSVVLNLQTDENRPPDEPKERLAEIQGRVAFGILGDRFPQLEYMQVTDEAGLVLADVTCPDAFPTLLRCP